MVLQKSFSNQDTGAEFVNRGAEYVIETGRAPVSVYYLSKMLQIITNHNSWFLQLDAGCRELDKVSKNLKRACAVQGKQTGQKESKATSSWLTPPAF